MEGLALGLGEGGRGRGRWVGVRVGEVLRYVLMWSCSGRSGRGNLRLELMGAGVVVFVFVLVMGE